MINMLIEEYKWNIYIYTYIYIYMYTYMLMVAWYQSKHAGLVMVIHD